MASHLSNFFVLLSQVYALHFWLNLQRLDFQRVE